MNPPHLFKQLRYLSTQCTSLFFVLGHKQLRKFSANIGSYWSNSMCKGINYLNAQFKTGCLGNGVHPSAEKYLFHYVLTCLQ